MPMVLHKTKRTLILAAASIALAASANAATITVDGAGMRDIRLWNSATLAPVGSRILVGYFDGFSEADIILHQLNTSLLQTKFIPFGLGGSVGQGVGGAPGYFTFNTSATVENPAPSFTAPGAPTNDQIYLWIFNSSVSPTEATQQAVVTFRSAIGTIFNGASVGGASDEWRWPVTDDGFTDRSISLDDNLQVLIGSVDTQALYLSQVPEPGHCALLGIGLLTLFARRRSARS